MGSGADGEKAEAWVRAHLELDRELLGQKPAPTAMAAVAFVFEMSLDGDDRLEFSAMLSHVSDILGDDEPGLAGAEGGGRSMGKDKLTQKQGLFCREFIIDLNASAAARRAGYSPKTAFRIGQENMQKPAIQARIAELQKKRSDKLEIRAEDVLRELAKIAYSNIGDFVDWDNGMAFKSAFEIPHELKACISGLSEAPGPHGTTIKFKLHPKTPALELIGKHLSMWTDKIQLGTDPTDPIMQAISRAQGVSRSLPKPVPMD